MMSRTQLLRLSILIGIALLAASGPLVGRSDGQVERIMRDIQARHFYLNGWRRDLHGAIPEEPAFSNLDHNVYPNIDPIDWPSCCGAGVPIFPADGYYDVPMQDAAFAVVAVRSISSGIHEVIGEFVAPDSLYPGTDGYERLTTSTIEFSGGRVSKSAFDPNGGWIGGAITESNYSVFLSAFSVIVSKLDMIDIPYEVKDIADGADPGNDWPSRSKDYFGVSAGLNCGNDVIGECITNRPGCTMQDLLSYLVDNPSGCTFSQYSSWCNNPVDTGETLVAPSQAASAAAGPNDLNSTDARVIEKALLSSGLCVSDYPNSVTVSFASAETNIYAKQDDPVPHEGSAELWIWVTEKLENRVFDPSIGEMLILHEPPVPGVWDDPLEVDYYRFGGLDPSLPTPGITVGDVQGTPAWAYDSDNLKLFSNEDAVYNIHHHDAGWTLSGKFMILQPDWPEGQEKAGPCASCCTLLAAQSTFVTSTGHSGSQEPPEPPDGCAAVPEINPEDTDEGAGCPETDADAASEASVDDAGAEGEGGCETCDDTGSGGGPGSASSNLNANPVTDQPVMVADGHKLEFATDLRVSLPGQDFYLRREYSSKTDLDGPDVVGNNWILPVTRMLTEEPSTEEIVLHGNVRGHIRFQKQNSTTDLYWPSSTTTTYATPEIDGDGDSVWRLTKPGVREVEFYDYGTQNMTDGLAGFIKTERDYFGLEG